MVNKCRQSLPEHYERHLGSIIKGWSDDASIHGIQIVSFRNQPEDGVNTYATLGLSNYVLSLSDAREIRQEIMVSANDIYPDADISGFLLSVAEFVMERRVALLRGEVIGPSRKPVIPGSTLTAVYATNPSPFEISLTEFHSEPPTVFAYLIPITSAEVVYLNKYGWKWFEEKLETQNPDIWDFSRSSEVHP